jgi:hypothetical protein
MTKKTHVCKHEHMLAQTAEIVSSESEFDLQLPMQSVPITTDVVSSNLDQGEVYNIMW